MGLNLNIRRIVFNTIYKNDGSAIVRLSHSAVKQIAGRAGRRNSPFPEGEVTCRDPRDLSYVRSCLGSNISDVEKAGILPTAAHVEKFGEALQEYSYDTATGNAGESTATHLHTLLQQFSDVAVVKGDYKLCRQSDMHVVATWLKDIPLAIVDKYTFCMAPVSTQNPNAREVLVKFGQKMASGEVPGLIRSGALRRATNFDDMAHLCRIYSEVELFIWLQNKFPPVNLMEQQAALVKKDHVASLITLGLSEAEKLKLRHCYVERDATVRQIWTQKREKPADRFEYYDDDWADDPRPDADDQDNERGRLGLLGR